MLKGVMTIGTVLKRAGSHVRMEQPGGTTIWVETKYLVAAEEEGKAAEEEGEAAQEEGEAAQEEGDAAKDTPWWECYRYGGWPGCGEYGCAEKFTCNYCQSKTADALAGRIETRAMPISQERLC